ncbi:MAG TPA: hypothetical protein DIW43_05065 [Spongiibacteraceae bacterium]|nr:hypothetical protein [Spongiibacteraceae bacterium]HCS26798.1 hypothetical protein [Spongiibacteraceae bacterium]
MDNNKKAQSSALLALTGAALALPGIAGKAHAAAPVSEPVLSYHATRYSEARLDSDKHLGGDSERYEIDTHQLGFASAIGKQTDIQLDLMVESMSGASPWYVQPGANNEPVQAMSGASIKEERVDLQSRFNRFVNTETVASLVLGYSDEDDYSAANIGFEFEKTLPQNQLTVTAGMGYSDDELEPTQGTTAVSVTSAEKDSLSAFVGLGFILNARTAVQTSLSITDQEGFLSDPYKLAYIASLANPLVSDNRPNDRRQWVWLTKFRHYVPSVNAAVHADYRYFDDDWDIESHTLELGWYQNLGNTLRVDSVLRYYSQTAAYFYAPFYLSPRSDGLASSDYRLSPYGALSLRLRVVKSLGPWQLSAQWEGYEAKASHSLKKVDVESPGLVEFNTFSIGFDRVF